VRYNNQIDWDEIEAGGFTRIIISPGPGTPENEADIGVSREVLRRARVPVLGVCLGHQGIGLEFGAQVSHAPEPMHGLVREVRHKGDILFSGIPETFEATRYHSLVVRKPLPDCLEEIAWTADGILMGLRHRTRPIWGVQFHPESIGTPWGNRILENFLRLEQSAVDARASDGVRIGQRRSWPQPPQMRTGGPDDLEIFHRIIWKGALDDGFFFRAFGGSAERFWLDSSAHEPGRSRFSYMGEASGPRGQVLRFANSGSPDDAERAQAFARDLAQATRRLAAGAADLPFDFAGGAVGYFGYEFRGGVEPPAGFASKHPDAQFIVADRFIAVDHQTATTYAVHLGRESEREAIEAWMDALERECGGVGPESCPSAAGQPVLFRLRHGKRAYLDRIGRALDYIRDGVSYEICLTNQIVTDAKPDPVCLYRQLRDTNPAPYSAFLAFPGVTVLSSSPECFLRLDQGGVVTAKPIKGTIRRGRDPAEDRALAEQLRTSEKDRAENLMIVDLLRNDLGRVCEIGSVHVPELMAIESYATVHQMVTTVRGRLAEGRDFIDCLLAAFPGGSMTGAPKTRTLALIEELEGGPRGIYSGAIGYLSANGAAEFNIVIRTIVLDDDGCSIGVGGAIVAASDPEAEFDEMMLKGRAPVEAIAACETGDRAGYRIETD
ncbi:MAG: aminodeoxychorismate synthase component I, partial [Sphingomonadales bacterium]